jgi:hypothetical protein
MTMPDRGPYPRAGHQDALLLCRLDDPDGARRFFSRLEAVCHAAAPRILEGLQEKLHQLDEGLSLDVRLVPAEGLFPSLRQLEVEIHGVPLPPIPKVTFGVVGRLLVVTTSGGALQAAMAVAAGEAPGLEEHPLAAGLLGRDDLASARLARHSRDVAEAVGAVGSLEHAARFVLGFAPEGEGTTRARETCARICERLRRVVQSFDFLGDELVTSRAQDGGLARYERSVQVLLGPGQRPYHSSSADAR